MFAAYPSLRQDGKFLEVFSDRGGLVAEILESGTIQKGDLISLKALPEDAYYYRNREPTT